MRKPLEIPALTAAEVASLDTRYRTTHLVSASLTHTDRQGGRTSASCPGPI